MNHYVPDFDMGEDCTLPTTSALAPPKKSITSEDEIMELLWQNGKVVVQSQTQMSLKKSPIPKYDDAVLPVEQPNTREIRSTQEQQQQHLFMQEDEMASWLHYPLPDTNFDQDFCADLLYPSAACVTSTTSNTSATPLHSIQNPESRPPPPPASATATAPRPPIPPTRRAEAVQNFAYFSKHRTRGGISKSGPSNLKPVVRESTVVDSSDTPAVMSDSRISEEAVARSTACVSSGDNERGTLSGAGGAGTSTRPGGGINRETMTCEITETSSPGGSSASAEPPSQKPATEDRKRKGREEETEYHSEDIEFESADTKKQVRGSTSTKRSRAAEVHNLSERRRRDRINEKMKALQELIPRCNKSDKASMLDEAIEYLKSLQLQVQMMSMGCSMVPMMFSGIQQYMPPLGMGMGMGMGMEMGMKQPMMPFPNVLAGSPLPTTAAAHLGPRFPMPGFHMPPVPSPVSIPDPSRIQAANPSNPILSAMSTQNAHQPGCLNFADPYQQYLGLQQMQIPVSQNQGMTQPSTSKPGTSQGAEHIDNHQPGT